MSEELEQDDFVEAFTELMELVGEEEGDWQFIDNAGEGENCGTGKGGFQPDNTCGSGKRRKRPDRTEIGRGRTPTARAVDLSRRAYEASLTGEGGIEHEAYEDAQDAVRALRRGDLPEAIRHHGNAQSSHGGSINMLRTMDGDDLDDANMTEEQLNDLIRRHREAIQAHSRAEEDLETLLSISPGLNGDGRSLYNQLTKNPGDNTTRSALADWLEENRREEDAARIRRFLTTNAGEPNCGTGAGGFKEGNVCGGRKRGMGKRVSDYEAVEAADPHDPVNQTAYADTLEEQGREADARHLRGMAYHLGRYLVNRITMDLPGVLAEEDLSDRNERIPEQGWMNLKFDSDENIERARREIHKRALAYGYELYRSNRIWDSAVDRYHRREGNLVHSIQLQATGWFIGNRDRVSVSYSTYPIEIYTDDELRSPKRPRRLAKGPIDE